MTNRKAGTPKADTPVDTLERALAELETALKENADWRALRRARSRAKRAAHEQALAGNPVYRAWSLLSQAAKEMRAGMASPGAPEAAAVRQAPEGNGGVVRARAERTAKRRRVGLREVLERVRSEATLDREARPAARGRNPSDPAGRAAGRHADDSARRPSVTPRIVLTDTEEAAVSFVVREPVEPGPADAEPSAAPGGAGEGPPPDAPDAAGRAAGAWDAGDAGDEAEAEVVIVPRSR